MTANHQEPVIKVHEAIDKVRFSIRQKQRSVESLVQSAQSTHEKVLSMLNEHIDQLELEKTRLRKVTDNQKEAMENLGRQVKDAKLEKDDLEQKTTTLLEEKSILQEQLNRLTTEKKDLAGKVDSLTGELGQKNREFDEVFQRMQTEIDTAVNDKKRTEAKMEKIQKAWDQMDV